MHEYYTLSMSFRPANIYVLWTSLVFSLFMYLCMYAISLLPCAIVSRLHEYAGYSAHSTAQVLGYERQKT